MNTEEELDTAFEELEDGHFHKTQKLFRSTGISILDNERLHMARHLERVDCDIYRWRSQFGGKHSNCSDVRSPKNSEARKMVETIKYEVIRDVGKVEIRRYPKIIVAKVEDPQADAFSILYRFIAGYNQQKLKVKITTPVVSQQISMTSPVFSETGTMAFVMPEEFTFESTPEPLDNKVENRRDSSPRCGCIVFFWWLVRMPF